MLSTIERPITLKSQALEILREAITLGQIKPGERLVERMLCDQLNVSRTVVRECIRHLESEKLVTSIPNVGPSVTELDADEVAEIYDIRALLESRAIKNCATNPSPDLTSQLEKACNAITTSLQAGDILEALKRTEKFYAAIFEYGNSSVGWDLVVHLNGRISWLRAVTLASPGRAESGPENLIKIVNAIKSGDPDAGQLACETHLEGARKIALDSLERENSNT